MNIWALSCVCRASASDLLEILRQYEEGEKNTKIDLYDIEEDNFLDILTTTGIDSSDQEIFVDFLRILDTRSRGVCSILQLLVSVAPFVVGTIPELFSLCFTIYDRDKREMLDKPQVVEIVKLVAQTCFYVGDKPLATELTYDLVNSAYTSAGKIDGEVFYKDFVEYLAMHPIVQLYTSIQFQGAITTKILSGEQIEALCGAEML
jgi:Ca2+-binding EF-hand superfamily protein